jgi:hypothetical protein
MKRMTGVSLTRLLASFSPVPADRRRSPTGETMALFDIFKKRKPIVPLPQLCYDIAYFVLPHYVYEDFAKLIDMCRHSPASAGAFFYFMACQMRKIKPDVEIAKTFQWHVGGLGDSFNYFTLSYPKPPPVDLSGMSPDDWMNSQSSLVLAPYFSTFWRDREGKRHYYILGQSPIGGGTTLRCIASDGANRKLGPGPMPMLEAFHAALNKTAEPEK